MKNYLSLQLLSPLCLRCNSLRVRPSLFCYDCETQFLIPRLVKQSRWVAGYKVEYLLSWIPQESDTLSALVYLLKSRWSFPVWNFLVPYFNIPSEAHLKTVIIPIPGNRPHQVAFHTQYFAEIWSKWTGYPMINALAMQDQGTGPDSAQKAHSLEERAQVRMTFLEEFTSFLYDHERIILIDDIVTSGFTLTAGLKALKPHLRPECQIEIKALLSREKL